MEVVSMAFQEGIKKLEGFPAAVFPDTRLRRAVFYPAELQ